METEELIKKTIENTFTILKELKKHGISDKTKMIIPYYNNNNSKEKNLNSKLRVSEQELRFIFVEQLHKFLPIGYTYSVETPTKCKYKFTENRKDCIPERHKGLSGNFDLTIQDENNQITAIVEFKSKSVKSHSYAKDLCKLWNKDEGNGECTQRYFINVFESMNKQTLNTLKGKITNNDYIKKQKNDIDIIIVCKSLNVDDKEYEYYGTDNQLSKQK